MTCSGGGVGIRRTDRKRANMMRLFEQSPTLHYNGLQKYRTTDQAHAIPDETTVFSHLVFKDFALCFKL